MSLTTELERFLRPRLATVSTSRRRVLVAFSGGPDSTTLLWGLRCVAPALGLDLVAAHLDHRLDADSGRRAAAAAHLAEVLEVPFVLERLASGTPAGESVEAYARRRRYEFLERLARQRDAAWVATAHHADDQAETVLLRLLYGSGLEGLAGIRRQWGRVVRPLLGLRRRALREALRPSGLEPVTDPTNAALDQPRSRVRRGLIPWLAERDPEIVERLCALARRARAAGRRSDELLAPLLVPVAADAGVALNRLAFDRLPGPLQGPALALLARRVGTVYPVAASARRELLRQLGGGGAVGCDCGHGWRFEADAETLRLERRKPKVGDFAYTLKVPGAVDIPELALRVRLEQGRVRPWMFRGRRDRAALAGPVEPGVQALIRNRRPGDRIRPLGGKQRVRLKDLLISRRVPRAERDRLPLLIIDGKIAWIPGVTIDERFRLTGQTSTWIARIEAR